MVSFSLIHRLRSAVCRLRIQRLLVIAGAVAGGSALVLIAVNAVKRIQPVTANQDPSLLELLERVRSQRLQPHDDAPSLRAPIARSWQSPLSRQCKGADARIQQRLMALHERSDEWRSRQPIHPTNFGDRYVKDAFGVPLNASPRVVVMHETVYSMNSAINTFQTPHPHDEDQVSYHTLIALDGQVVDLVDPLKRAYGAGNSAFLGEWAVTNRRLDGSVNNFALHVSLETPIDGETMQSHHSGYTARQYDSLALVLSDWLERFNLPAASITTHRHVDLGGERSDPRSFDWTALQQRLAALDDLCVE